jgi:hypothetical protein
LQYPCKWEKFHFRGGGGVPTDTKPNLEKVNRIPEYICEERKTSYLLFSVQNHAKQINHNLNDKKCLLLSPFPIFSSTLSRCELGTRVLIKGPGSPPADP